MEEVCILCEKQAIEHFGFWKIVENSFPYDLIAKINHILVPVRHTGEFELDESEKEELQLIKKDFLSKKYDYLLENLPKNQSIPEHFHMHLIVGK